MVSDFKNHYVLLEIEMDASIEEIRRAYKRAVLKFHPDVSKDSNAERLFCDVTKAYQVLKEPGKRLAYDEKLKKSMEKKTEETVVSNPKRVGEYSPGFFNRLMSSLTIHWHTFPDHFGFRHLALDNSLADLSIHDLQSRLLLSQNPHVRRHAIRALRLKKSKPAILAMLNGLSIKDDFICREVIRHLEGLPVKMGLYPILKAWNELSESSKWSAVELFRTIPKKKMVSYIDMSIKDREKGNSGENMKELMNLL